MSGHTSTSTWSGGNPWLRLMDKPDASPAVAPSPSCLAFIWMLGGLMGIPGLRANRAQSADGWMEREYAAPEAPPVRQPNTIDRVWTAPRP